MRRRRSYRRNPALLGFQLPPLDAVLFTGAGLIVPPLVTKYVMDNFVPVEYRANKGVYYLVKATSVLVPSLLVRKFVSQRAGNLMLLGGAASFAIDLVRDFVPGLLPGMGAQPFLGFYERMPARGVGRYLNGGRAPAAMIQNVPERLSPQNRF